jgi:hypothetical protein
MTVAHSVLPTPPLPAATTRKRGAVRALEERSEVDDIEGSFVMGAF